MLPITWEQPADGPSCPPCGAALVKYQEPRSALQSQLDALDERLSRQLGRLQEQSDRLLDTVLRKLEAKVSSISNNEKLLDWRLSELSSSMKGLQDELQLQVRRSNAADSRNQKWRKTVHNEVHESLQDLSPRPWATSGEGDRPWQVPQLRLQLSSPIVAVSSSAPTSPKARKGELPAKDLVSREDLLDVVDILQKELRRHVDEALRGPAARSVEDLRRTMCDLSSRISCEEMGARNTRKEVEALHEELSRLSRAQMADKSVSRPEAEQICEQLFELMWLDRAAKLEGSPAPLEPEQDHGVQSVASHASEMEERMEEKVKDVMQALDTKMRELESIGPPGHPEQPLPKSEDLAQSLAALEERSMSTSLQVAQLDEQMECSGERLSSIGNLVDAAVARLNKVEERQQNLDLLCSALLEKDSAVPDQSEDLGLGASVDAAAERPMNHPDLGSQGDTVPRGEGGLDLAEALLSDAALAGPAADAAAGPSTSACGSPWATTRDDRASQNALSASSHAAEAFFEAEERSRLSSHLSAGDLSFVSAKDEALGHSWLEEVREHGPENADPRAGLPSELDADQRLSVSVTWRGSSPGVLCSRSAVQALAEEFRREAAAMWSALGELADIVGVDGARFVAGLDAQGDRPITGSKTPPPDASASRTSAPAPGPGPAAGEAPEGSAEDRSKELSAGTLQLGHLVSELNERLDKCEEGLRHLQEEATITGSDPERSPGSSCRTDGRQQQQQQQQDPGPCDMVITENGVEMQGEARAESPAASARSMASEPTCSEQSAVCRSSSVVQEAAKEIDCDSSAPAAPSTPPKGVPSLRLVAEMDGGSSALGAPSTPQKGVPSLQLAGTNREVHEDEAPATPGDSGRERVQMTPRRRGVRRSSWEDAVTKQSSSPDPGDWVTGSLSARSTGSGSDKKTPRRILSSFGPQASPREG